MFPKWIQFDVSKTALCAQKFWEELQVSRYLLTKITQKELRTAKTEEIHASTL